MPRFRMDMTETCHGRFYTTNEVADMMQVQHGYVGSFEVAWIYLYIRSQDLSSIGAGWLGMAHPMGPPDE